MKLWHQKTDVRTLTARQREIMEYVVLGKSNADIGAILGISVCTVKNHLVSCRNKLFAGNKVLLVAKYLCPERFKPKDVVTETIGREPVIIGKP